MEISTNNLLFIKDCGILIRPLQKVLAPTDSFNGEPVDFDVASRVSLPSEDEWRVIKELREEINQMLSANGGEPLGNQDYWSRTRHKDSPKEIIIVNPMVDYEKEKVTRVTYAYMTMAVRVLYPFTG